MENSLLRRLQLTELEILKTIDLFCKRNSIEYSLYSGTLLGAVRHQGFIPWDDDMDICMSRKEYERFIQLWLEEPPTGYVIQNKELCPAFDQSFTKIRKDHTTFLQEKDRNLELHTGVFIDIFPIDRIPKGKIKRFMFTFNCMKYQLYTREFIPPKGNFLVKFVSSIFLKAVPADRRPNLRKKLLGKLTQCNDDTTLEMVSIETVERLKKIQRSDWLSAFVPLRFEDSEFPCCAGWDENLRRTYGDYMSFPPKEEQICKHSPVLLDFEKNIDEINSGEE